MLLLVQSKAQDEAPYILSGAVAKLAGITFWSLASSYWIDKPWFLTEGKFATVLIIPSSWGSQLDGDLHQHRAASQLHMATFGDWLRRRLMNDNDVEEQLYLLVKLPSSTILTFQGYEINANTFYMVAQDKKSTNQNSGVRFDAVTDKGRNDTYYGYMEEIWELDYGPSFKVPLFWCKWVKMTGGRVKLDEQYRMTMVDFNNLGTLTNHST
jgi:hypothetical protein